MSPVCMEQHREPKPQMNAAGFPPPISAGNPWPPPPSWVKLPPLTQAEQGENGVFDNDSPLPQNRGHAADHIRRFRELRKIDAGKTARCPSGKMWDQGGSTSRARRHRDWRSHSALLQHSDDNHAMTPETELLLFEANRSQLLREKIKPALWRGVWVTRGRMAENSDEFHERVIRAYRKLAENEPRRVILVYERISPDTVENQVWI